MSVPVHGGAEPVASGPAVGRGNRPEMIQAVPMRRPGRLVVAVLIVVLLALFLYGAATNSAYDWGTFGRYLFDQRVSQAAAITLSLTALAMFFAIVLGVILAVMRLSPNPVLKWVSWVFVWFFRGTPVYVQLVFWGLLVVIYKHIDLGIPFVHQFAHISTQSLFTPYWLAVLGLSLNESAYMAEIVRAGISSVDEGQEEAARALGMSWGQSTLRIVLPQAMRVIIPPTGNELISMLKTTSLVTAVPYTLELYSRTRDLAVETYNPIPMLLVASAWYLFFTSVLMVGQFYLERYFARGASRKMSAKQLQALANAQSLGSMHGGI
ncbi:amino acid ABC transporter permease [Jatrophihabitans sp. DSM 44399]|jgi:polar amino acid transport system permease protein|uniref:Amino acid ABC transporter permease n=2 Tax=Jatrophihabitans lederbergiae TaxID=3075547 RepID=A0ABU2J9Y5_9ACTN|nr:amino acid ABC transporter permease [Jatrophihabitans sp. DSM 44399]MDT0261772.1 amino acid ABC transporter permease [Jatrophihabitans sp. DSM 44399]